MSNIPKVRFSKYTDGWKQNKLSEFGKATGGTSIESEFVNNGDYKVISIGSYSDMSKYTDQGLRANKTSKTEGRILNKGDLTMVLNDKTASGNIIGRVLLIDTDNAYVYNQRTERIEVYKNDFEPEFLYFLLNADKVRKQIIGSAQGNTQIYVNWTAISKLKYYIPKEKDEQQKIAKLLRVLDNLIVFHQREYEKLVALKAACLDKMFPKNGSKVPEIRFAVFSGDWEQSKFKDSFEFLTNNTLSRADLDERNGSIYNLHYGDILVKFGETLNLERDGLPYISDRTNMPKTDFLQNGDVIIADTAEDAAVGKCTEIIGASNLKIVSGLHTIPCRPYKEFAKGYLGYFMNSPVYHDQLVPLMQGTKVTSISKSALQGTMIYYPSDIKEQTLIGEFFMGLNNLITLQQKKVKKLKQIKQALLHNMFV